MFSEERRYFQSLLHLFKTYNLKDTFICSGTKRYSKIKEIIVPYKRPMSRAFSLSFKLTFFRSFCFSYWTFVHFLFYLTRFFWSFKFLNFLLVPFSYCFVAILNISLLFIVNCFYQCGHSSSVFSYSVFIPCLCYFFFRFIKQKES